MIGFLAMLGCLLLTVGGVARAANKAGRALAKVPGVTVRTVKRGLGKTRDEILLNLWVYWYASKKRVLPQERFLFGGFRKIVDATTGAVRWAIRRFRGLLGGRGLGKSMTLMKKVVILSALNKARRGRPPIMGAIFGRTLKEVEHKLLPVLMQICAEMERDLGVKVKPTYDKQNGVLYFPWGSGVYLLSYEDPASLELARGYNLAWAVIDELEVARVPIEKILAVINFAIRDVEAGFKAFVWASTPKGLKGMPKLHLEAKRRNDDDWYLVHGTIYDNPYLAAADIEAIRRTIPSKRLWAQEGLAICVMPRHTVFPEYSEGKHLKAHRWVTSDKTWISIDWGLSKAYVCAFKINPRGEWFCVMERKVVDTTRKRFRAIVKQFVAEVQALDGGAAPYGISCDRAVTSERVWLLKTFAKLCTGKDHAGRKVVRILWLAPTTEFRVEWGCAIISSLLEPEAGAPKFYVSDALTADTDFATIGMRGAFQRYTYEIGKDKETGEETILDTPAKTNAADDPIDAARYAIVATRHMPELHGGKALPFLAAANDNEAEGEASDAA